MSIVLKYEKLPTRKLKGLRHSVLTLVFWDKIIVEINNLLYWLKARLHLYANANKACGTKMNANECQKVACSAFATQANKQAFCWLFVGCSNGFSYPSHPRCSTWRRCQTRKWQSVHSHQYDCERIFLWSTDFRRIASACSLNICRISEWRRMLFAYTFTLCVSHVFLGSFRICVQMWTRLYTKKITLWCIAHFQNWGISNKKKSFCPIDTSQDITSGITTYIPPRHFETTVAKSLNVPLFRVVWWYLQMRRNRRYIKPIPRGPENASVVFKGSFSTYILEGMVSDKDTLKKKILDLENINLYHAYVYGTLKRLNFKKKFFCRIDVSQSGFQKLSCTSPCHFVTSTA